LSGRPDGRPDDALRPIEYELGYQDWAEGSILFRQGRTRVLVAASVEDEAARWLRGTGKGWVTGEYAMLPRATSERTGREVNRGRPGGQEIQRLIGRSLRAVTDLSRLGERTVMVDCDVLLADAGTRCASITAGWIALAQAVGALQGRGVGEKSEDIAVTTDSVAAVSVAIVDGRPVLDPTYEEDAAAEVDFNVVMTGSGKLVEVQGTAEGEPFDRKDLDRILDLAGSGIRVLTDLQRAAVT
jgi:ribonuclease PH